jgi:hypothetical protein
MALVTLLRRDASTWRPGKRSRPTPSRPPPCFPGTGRARRALRARGTVLRSPSAPAAPVEPARSGALRAGRPGPRRLRRLRGLAGAVCPHRSDAQVRAVQMAAAGRWSLSRIATRLGRAPGRRDRGIEMPSSRCACCWIATGWCFRRLCTREPGLPRWRELVAVYHPPSPRAWYAPCR